MSEVQQNFSIWMESRSLLNPASAGEVGSASLQLAYASYSGVRKNIRTLYAGGFKRLGLKKDSLNYHCLGLGVYSDQPGKYTRKNRAHLYYAYHLSINEHTIVSLGFSAGAYNYFVKDNPSAVTASATTPDGSIGGQVIFNQKTFIGLAIQQVIGNTLQPIETEIQLERGYVANFRQKVDLSYKNKLDIGAYYRLLGNNLEDDYSIYGLLAHHIRTFSLQGGLNYRGRFGLDCILMAASKLGKGELQVGFSYNIKTQSEINTSAEYQLSFNYIIR